jgi:hypothetical protein
VLNNKKYHLIFQPMEGAVKMDDLSRFFYYFKATYAICYEYTKEHKANVTDIIINKTKWIEYVNIKMAQYRAAYKFFTKDLDKEDIFVYKVYHESPLTLLVGGVLIALVMAVIISGVKADLKNLTFELNPLGEGVEKLRRAFRKKKKN